MATAKQTQIAKPVAKAAAKAAAAKKAAPAKKAATQKAATQKAAAPAAPTNGAKFYVKASGRPGSGKGLFAYTAAWLQETGLIDGGSIPRAVAVQLAGATAIGYHVTSTGRFIDNGGQISLAPNAANAFMDRAHDAAQREVFREVLRGGIADGKHVRQQWMVAPIDAQ